ncbi:MAG: glycoside hydrolase family 99-like domain-containing protein [Lewinellaceae bacterium]|nr:glycoside hydrolase family 99-like domain-containing protein [Lewinellaceae bacterium]
MSEIRPIAFYLPQYHPILENDTWWGKGFTEWRNVVQAKPLFKGHYQPHLPADLGFYDLRLPEVRHAQVELAKKHGIHGFCYYHYWFNGKRLLERPLNDVLASEEPDFPFCLCWANENWTRRWDGQDQEVLIKQNYTQEDNLNHIRYLAQVFSDSRYIRINGKPLFLVYKASAIPDPKQAADTWRNEAMRLGIGELYLCRVESFNDERNDPVDMGFDASVEFQPDWLRLPFPMQKGRRWNVLQKMGIVNKAFRENNIHSYEELVNNMIQKEEPHYIRFNCVTPSWDNTARRLKGNATIFHGSTPDLYKEWLKSAIKKTLHDRRKNNILFINAWNEWAEGNHLEPCQKWGHAYLQATLEVINGVNEKQ